MTDVKRTRVNKPPHSFTQDRQVEFVTAWQAASSPKEAADELGLPLSVASSYATRLRRAGVALKKFARPGAIDTAALNSLIGSDK